MSQTSDIEWTDATWNPVRGCTKVSPGCANCYAETFAERWRGVKRHAYEQGFDLRLVPEKLDEPLRWTKPSKVFVNSMSDLFQDGVPDAFILAAFAVMANARQHTFQVLTKRPERMRAFVEKLRWMVGFGVVEISGRPHLLVDLPVINGDEWDRIGGPGKPVELRRFVPPNIWLGVSVENQHFADERIPLLLQTPAAVRFISAEPLLGPVNLTHVIDRTYPKPSSRNTLVRPPCSSLSTLDWVIVGGESGHGARPFDVAWARSIVRQCQAAGVPAFVKQFGVNVRDRNDAGFEGDNPGAWPMDTDVIDNPDGYRNEYQGAPVRIRLRKKGGDMSEWPEDLRIREFPEVRA